MKRSIVMFTVLYLVTNNVLDVSSRRLKREREERCDPIPEPRPDFKVAGQRISEQKCEEYKWIVKFWEQHQLENPSRCPRAGEYPNLAAIGWVDKNGSWQTRCAGSLVSSKFVVAAAHCFSIESPKPVVIRFGDKNLLNQDGVVEGKIKRAILHPEYTKSEQFNDIALLELEEEITFSKNVLPACLWTEVDVSSLGKFANTTGWGQLKSDQTATKPKIANVQIIDKDTCEERLAPHCGRKCIIKDTQICADNFFVALEKTGQWEKGNQCGGYSGAPLQVRALSPGEGALNYVIGVSSYGARCASDTVPDVYTRLASYTDWIETNVWP